MKGLATCKICGRDFALMKEEHVIVKDPSKKGVIPSLVDTDKALIFDSFDCPHCGCQYVAQQRKPIWIPEFSNDKKYEDYNECEGCRYVECDEQEEPCMTCRRSFVDHYKIEEEEENNE